MPPAFGSSGIRGPFATLATPELALALGRAVGATRKRVVVGRDARTTGPLLQQAAIAGLLSSGAHVVDAGVLPTPALANHARAGFDAGLVITASHNPAPDNGFKLWEPDGRAFGAAARADIERRLADPPALAAWDAVGSLATTADAIERHVQRILDLVPLRKRLRVVLDCGNGAASRESPDLLRRLGCDVITLNAQPDGAFPGRPSEPNEENLAKLRAAVVSFGADVGLAHDGDADRCMAVASSGRFVTGDELLVLFATAHAGKTIVCPVDASRVVEDATGCRVVRTKVGDAFVSDALAEHRAAFGGEASGAWIFPEMSYCPDGPLAAAKVCALVAEHGPLDAQVAAIPRYPLWRHAWRVEDRTALMSRFTDALGDGKVTSLDGVRSDYDDGWILVRPSGTEPKVRVTVEAVDERAMERLKAKVARVMPF